MKWPRYLLEWRDDREPGYEEQLAGFLGWRREEWDEPYDPEPYTREKDA